MQSLHEYVGNMHVHTPYSDGEAFHAEIARLAIAAGLDFVIVTDHNVWVQGVEGYYGEGATQQLLLLSGEEVHDQQRDPQANHLLIYGAERELARYAANPQTLIDESNASNGLTFLAHPVEVAAPLFHEDALSWVSWDIDGYTGIELWNYMSEFKRYLTSRVKAIQAAFKPEKFISGPFEETLALWDNLLKEGKQVSVIGGADAHGTTYSMGPVSRVIFPYEYLFRCVNTHILTTQPMNGDFEHDKRLVLRALKDGQAFVAYDLPAPTRGFRFSAQGLNASATVGGSIRLRHGVTLQIALPGRPAEMRLIKNGEPVLTEAGGTHWTYIADEIGAYRVEAYTEFMGARRGWIFSNPIYILE
nr:PHP domain-containing protein [Anaerolineae bacterium]